MGLGVFGVWVAMVIDWVVRAICFVIRYFNGKWKHGAILVNTRKLSFVMVRKMMPGV